MVLYEVQQQVPGRVLFGNRNQLLERLTDPFEKRDNPQEFVFGHPIAIQPACRGSSQSSRPSPPVRRRNLACPVQDSAAAIHRDPSRIRCRADNTTPSWLLGVAGSGNDLLRAQGSEQIVEGLFGTPID